MQIRGPIRGLFLYLKTILFPPLSGNDTFSPSHATSFLDSYCALLALTLPYIFLREVGRLALPVDLPVQPLLQNPPGLDGHFSDLSHPGHLFPNPFQVILVRRGGYYPGAATSHFLFVSFLSLSSFFFYLPPFSLRFFIFFPPNTIG